MLRERGDVSNGEVGCSGNKELRVEGLAGKRDARGTGQMQVSRGSERWDAQGTRAVGTGSGGEVGRGYWRQRGDGMLGEAGTLERGEKELS